MIFHLRKMEMEKEGDSQIMTEKENDLKVYAVSKELLDVALVGVQEALIDKKLDEYLDQDNLEYEKQQKDDNGMSKPGDKIYET